MYIREKIKVARSIHKRPFANLQFLCGTISKEPERREGNVQLHMSLQIGTAHKKITQRLTRREGRQHGGRATGQAEEGGNICEATTLWKGSAACPPVCPAASCTTLTHMVDAAHTQININNTLIRSQRQIY